MNPSLTDTLCTRCGLCCDGTLFADVELVGEAETARLEIMGLEIEDCGTGAGLLSQPCEALKGTQCGIYHHRPNCCRTFECLLLQDAQRGVVGVAEAIEVVAEAQKRIRHVRKLLAECGEGDRRLPLKERCAEALAGDADASREAKRKRAALAAAMSGAETMIEERFLGSGEPVAGANTQAISTPALATAWPARNPELA